MRSEVRQLSNAQSGADVPQQSGRQSNVAAMPRPLVIGPYTFRNPWILAPMAGVSEMPFRVISLQFGAAAAPTELVSAKGLLYGQARTQRYLTHDAEVEQPFWVQIFGGDPDSMADGAERAAELGAKIIDINMGCPVRKVTRNGAGSALLCDPERAASIVESIRTRTGLPVTAKIRSGWDHHTINAVAMTEALAQGGCAAVAIHGRTRAQGYSGKANWELIREVAQVAPIPVIGNGDVTTPHLARKMMRQTGCAAVMIGRGALGNPWMFQQLTDASAQPPSPLQRLEVIHQHLEAHLAFVDDEVRGLRRFRNHLMWYSHGLRGATAFRRGVNQLETLAEVKSACDAFFASAQADHTSGPGTAPIELKNALG